MSETIFARVKFKKKTTAGWAAANEVLQDGEPGIEVLVDGTEKIKYGDGVKTWAQLSYAAGGGGGAALSNATPQALGTAAAGTSAEASRADHRHQMPTAGQVGADASGTAAAAVAAHAAAEDPHPGYALESDSRLSDARTPTAHKTTHATGGTDALSPADIGAATAAQGAKADSAVQPAGLTKAAVGLGNADNTSDADKPVSTATATALAGKAGTGAIGSSGLTMATARLLGRTTAGAGAVEEIQVSGGTFANGVLTLSGLPSTLTADANGNLTFSGRWIQSTNGAASAPPMALTGTWFTGGTSTTTKPQLLIEPAGTTSTSWNTAGTGLGVNAPSGFGGNLLDLQVGGVSRFKFDNGNKRFHLYTDGTRGDCYFDRSGGGGDPALVALGTTLDFNFLGFRGVSAARFHGQIASAPDMPGTYNLDGYVLTSAQLELWGHPTQQNRRIIGGNRSLFDEAPIHFEIRARDRGAGTSSWINTTGSHLYLAGGAAVSAATNAAHGGNVYLDGGRAYGTGIVGNIIIGQIRGNLEFTDQRNVIFSTSTGTRIGTDPTQKFAFWNATPVTQPAAVADATDAASVITQLNLALARLRTLGLIAT